MVIIGGRSPLVARSGNLAGACTQLAGVISKLLRPTHGLRSRRAKAVQVTTIGRGY
jgi:hypothetical protein